MNIRSNLTQLSHSRNFRHGILYTFFSFLNNGINFILLLILARFLYPNDYGELNLFTTFVTLINLIIALGTSSYIANVFFQKSRQLFNQLLVIVFSTAGIMTLLLSLLIFFFPESICRLVGISINYLHIAILICFFQVFNAVNLDIWRLEEKPVSYGLYGLSLAICNFILTMWLIVGLKMGWPGRVYAWGILGFLYFVISIVFLIKRHYLKITTLDISLLKETLLYALPLLPHLMSFWLKSGLDRYIINYFHDATSVGYFSFAMNLAAIINMIGMAFNSTNSVYIFKKLTEGYSKAKNVLYKQNLIMTIAFLVISTIVGILATGLIIWFLPKYLHSIRYILPLCIAGFFQCIYLLWVNYLFFYKKTPTLMTITLTTSIIHAGLSFWLTRYDIIFTAYISMFITFITMILVYQKSKKILSLQV